MEKVKSGAAQAGKHWWGITGAYAILIAIGAVIPIPAPQVRGLSLDKLLHLCEYLLLAWCIVQTAKASRFPQVTALTAAFLLSTSYGVLLEGVQHLLPYRQAEWLDVAVNTIGAAIGVLVGRGTQGET